MSNDTAPGEVPFGTPRFLADVMLERLARWLRATGADVASAPGTAPDAAVRRQAAAERRVLLTRDRRLAAECAGDAAAGPGTAPGTAPCYRVRAAAPLAQLAEVAAAFGLGELVLRLTRCLVCNGVLRPAAAVEGFTTPVVPVLAVAPMPVAPMPVAPMPVAPMPVAPVPPDKPRWRCAGCGRVYWEGSHARRMREALDRAFGRPAPAGHAACSPGAPQRHPDILEDPMSGSPGNTSTGTKGGRPAQNANHDLTARHGDDLAHGVRHSDDTGASTSARVTESGEADTRRRDPDDPANTHANQSEE